MGLHTGESPAVRATVSPGWVLGVAGRHRARQRLRLWSCLSPSGWGQELLLPSRFPECFRSDFVTAREERVHVAREACTPGREGPLQTAAGTHHHQIKSGFRMSQKHVLYSDKKHTWLSDSVIKHCER